MPTLAFNDFLWFTKELWCHWVPLIFACSSFNVIKFSLSLGERQSTKESNRKHHQKIDIWKYRCSIFSKKSRGIQQMVSTIIVFIFQKGGERERWDRLLYLKTCLEKWIWFRRLPTNCLSVFDNFVGVKRSYHKSIQNDQSRQ